MPPTGATGGMGASLALSTLGSNETLARRCEEDAGDGFDAGGASCTTAIGVGVAGVGGAVQHP